jgi:hypothetical protein
MKFKLIFCVLIALAIPAAIFAESAQNENTSGLRDATILVIRHAEDADVGSGLSSVGAARARDYAIYFKNFTLDGRPLKLDYIFATRDSRNSHRPRLTIEPTGQELGLTIDDRFKNNQFMELVDEIKSRPHGANILISWHHGKIPQLLRALGADPRGLLPNGKWPDDAFSWLIQLRYNENGHLFESKRIYLQAP